MLTKQCARCRKIIPYGTTYCADCQPIVDKAKQKQKRQSNRRYDAKRDPRYVQFYHSGEWKTLSRLTIQKAGYICEYCHKEIATEVDHVVPIDEDWSRRYDTSNLKAACARCHNKKHGRFTPGVGKKV